MPSAVRDGAYGRLAVVAVNQRRIGDTVAA